MSTGLPVVAGVALRCELSHYLWMISRVLTLLSAVAMLTGCYQTQVTLDYQPRPASNRSGKAEYDVGSVLDLRGVAPSALGRVVESHHGLREEISLSTSAEETVRNALLHGLASRGMLSQSGGAKTLLSVELDEFYCELRRRPFASCKLRVVARSAAGKELYRAAYAASRQDSGYERGYTDPVDDLRELSSRTLQDAVDKALDDERLHVK